VTVTRIDEYQVMYSSNKNVPRIWLKSGGNDIGQLIFMPNGSALVADYITRDDTVGLWYHLDDFQNVIDLLRNEAPVYLIWNGSTSENAIRTGVEMVGEGENES
jgi:hypothetical protein